MKVRFLLDENQSPRLKTTLLRLHPSMDVLRVGDVGAPALETLDPDILNYLALSGRALVTSNRRSMRAHVEAHWAEGGYLTGVFWVRPRTPLLRLAQELAMIWEASEAEEWLDRLEWIPF